MHRLPGALAARRMSATHTSHAAHARSKIGQLTRALRPMRGKFTLTLAALLVLALTPRHAAAQGCYSATSSVPDCVQDDLHTTASSGTLTFTIENDDVLDHVYGYWTNCSGGVTSCSASGTYYVPAGTSTTVEMTYTLTGDGVADAIVDGDDGSEMEVSQVIYQQAALEIDSAQTPIYGIAPAAAQCAAACFTATASIATVPFYTLGQARGVTLVYNEDRAHPKPFIYATVTPACTTSLLV